MPETFLILLAGGVMLAAALSDPRQVTLPWLRLAGILALAFWALAGFFHARRGVPAGAGPWVAYALGVAAVLGQLAFVQVARRSTQRAFAAGGFLLALLVAACCLPRGTGERGGAGPAGPEVWASLAGVAATTGLALMDMLLGHAYLTASRMTLRPFARLNGALAAALAGRGLTAGGLALALQAWRPVRKLWAVYGLLLGTRWLVGLAVPAVFVYMAHDCIRRRATQSATGILYVTGVLVFIGEIIALDLVRQTGLPF